MTRENKIRLAYYGDDFTGSTDALEFLSRAGLRTVLFFCEPTAEQIGRFGKFDAIGIAGMTRAMAPAEMQKTLDPVFDVLRDLNPRHVHYKVCSTFDSSPGIGNIGTAIERGQRIFKNSFTPVLVAAPHLGRYSAFGNLFAQMGIGSNGEVYRLDRHPSMCAHPVTPATESDLPIHLSRQTKLPIGLIDLLDLQKSSDDIRQKLGNEISTGKRIVFFDAMYAGQMAKIGEVFESVVPENGTLFSVGSSGVEKALGDFWKEKQLFSPKTEWKELDKSGPMIVLSGSVSPVTADQISFAVKNGFEEVAVEPKALEAEVSEFYIDRYREKMEEALKKGRSVILHTAIGPADSRVAELKKIFGKKGWNDQEQSRETAAGFGRILGQSARGALEKIKVKRLVIAGGDTSGYVARELGIWAVEMVAPVFPGAPVCKAFAAASPVDGMELNLKGGQVGDEAYFVKIQNGK